MRRFLVLATIVTVVSTAAATSAAAASGTAPARAASGGAAAAGPTLPVSSQLDVRRYAASGDRAYELGTEDGRYPAMGFHTRGEMGGIWTPPIKLLDGIWFGVNGQWIGPATTFTSGFGYVHMALPSAGGVQLSRTDFTPDGRRAVEIGLTLSAGLNLSSGKPLTGLAANPVYQNGGEIPLTPRGAGFQTSDGFRTRTPFTMITARLLASDSSCGHCHMRTTLTSPGGRSQTATYNSGDDSQPAKETAPAEKPAPASQEPAAQGPATQTPPPPAATTPHR